MTPESIKSFVSENRQDFSQFSDHELSLRLPPVKVYRALSIEKALLALERIAERHPLDERSADRYVNLVGWLKSVSGKELFQAELDEFHCRCI